MTIIRNILFFTISTFLLTGVIPFITASEDPRDITLTVPSGIPISELEQFIDEFAAEHIGLKTAGAAVAVIKNGELIFNKTYGYEVLDEKKALEDSVFEWGSATKLLVWTGVMQLAEQGKIDLNADIQNYLPPKFLRKLKYSTPVTMYNLMNHNAGWEDRLIDLFYARPETVPSLREALLSWEPAQVFPPGTVVAYSNFGTALAGFIVELVSGKPFYEYVRENIFEPLGMRDTAIHPLLADNPSVAERRGQIKGHIQRGGKPAVSKNERIFIGLYPAGSVTGTARDAAKFLAALMPLNESVLFSDNKTLDEMLSVSLSFREGFPRFSHGFMEYYSAVRALGHGGNTVAFSSLFTFAPEERFGLVVMANQAGELAMCYDLTRALFGGYVPPEYSGDLPEPAAEAISRGSPPDAREFSGLFTMARRPKNGFTNLIMSLSFLPLKPVDETTLDLAGARFIQVSPYVFKNTGGFPPLDFIDFLFIETENGPEGNSAISRISIIFSDFLPVGTGRVIINMGSAILFVLCILYVFAAIIITITGAVKNRKKGVLCNLMKKLNIVLYMSTAAAVANNVILAIRALSFSVYASLSVHFIINIVYVIFVPVFIGFMLANRKKETAKASKVFNIFSMAASVIFAVLLVVWQFWR